MKTAIQFALIGLLLSILEMLIYHFTGNFGHWSANIFSYAITIVVIVGSVYMFKMKENDGYLNVSEGIIQALRTGLFYGVLGSILAIVYIKVINPDFMNGIMEQQIAKMEEQGLDENQIEQAMKFANIFTSPLLMFAFGILGQAFQSVIIGLITSLVIKKEKPVEIQNANPS